MKTKLNDYGSGAGGVYCDGDGKGWDSSSYIFYDESGYGAGFSDGSGYYNKNGHGHGNGCGSGNESNEGQDS